MSLLLLPCQRQTGEQCRVLVDSGELQLYVLREQITTEQSSGVPEDPRVSFNIKRLRATCRKPFFGFPGKVSRKDFTSLIHGGEYFPVSLKPYHSYRGQQMSFAMLSSKDRTRVSSLQDSATEVNMTKSTDESASFSKHVAQGITTIKGPKGGAPRGKSSHR